MRIYYPDDDDGDALRRVAEHGADMCQPMKIEFSINVPDIERAHSLHEGVVAAQSELNELCAQFGAECDGWITDGNRQDH